MIVKSIIAKLQNKFHESAAETDERSHHKTSRFYPYILYQLDGEAEMEINWEWLYGKLSPGTYRITKILTDSSRNDPNVNIPAYPLTAQFIIAGN